MIEVVAAVLLVALVAYAAFAGADFGAGFWDLIAGGSERGAEPRRVIDRAIGPVWEANHVWLIFVFVVVWTAFSEAYAAIWLTLFVPLSIAALGIVLRGAGFAFRKSVTRPSAQRAFGALFAIPSVLVPFCLGTVIGAIASGRVPATGEAGDPVASWLNPTSILVGLLAVVLAAYLASVYLVVDAGRIADAEMVRYFRRRAIVAAIVAGAVVGVDFLVLPTDAPSLFRGLISQALPVVLAAVVLGVLSLVLLLRGVHSALTRVTAALAVGAVIVGWGVAQWPYILPPTLTFAESAAPSGTLAALIVATAIAAVVVLPALIWLYRLDQSDALPEEGVDEPAPAGDYS